MQHTFSAGGVVMNARGEILVTNQNGNSWSLPKGHIDPGEDARAAAVREIFEETGLAPNALLFVRELGSYDRYKIAADGVGDDVSELKTITMFLYSSTQEILAPIDAHHPEARWVARADVAELLTHAKDKEFFQRVIEALKI